MRENGLESDWEKYLDSRGGALYLVKSTGYLERRASEALARCGELLHQFIGVTRKPALEKTITQPYRQTWRVYGAELGDDHLSSLRTAADAGSTIKFKGQAHTVSRCQGGWTTAAGEQNTHAGNEVFDLHKVRK